VGTVGGPVTVGAACPLRHAIGDRWFVDETCVEIAGRWRYLYRAVDQYRQQVIDVVLLEQRDTAAARRFSTWALTRGPAPVEVATDRARPHLRVLDDLVPAAMHRHRPRLGHVRRGPRAHRPSRHRAVRRTTGSKPIVRV